MNVSKPSARMFKSVCIQRTGLMAWRTSRPGMAAVSAFTAASTFMYTGIVGAAKVFSANSASSLRAAGSISAQWNGALTASFLPRMRDSRAMAMARSTASASPEITVWPGQL